VPTHHHQRLREQPHSVVDEIWYGALKVQSFPAIVGAAGEKGPKSEQRVRFANRCNGQSRSVVRRANPCPPGSAPNSRQWGLPLTLSLRGSLFGPGNAASPYAIRIEGGESDDDQPNVRED
jgi:hypothetical protein